MNFYQNMSNDSKEARKTTTMSLTKAFRKIIRN